MRKEAPRIFRSLERPRGPHDFDTIVAAAVAAYASLRTPTERQSQELGRLVVPLWQRIGSDVKRSVAASLSHAERMPRDLVQLLIASSIEESAPFLISSPALTPQDLARLSAQPDPRVSRILSGRNDARHGLDNNGQKPDQRIKEEAGTTARSASGLDALRRTAHLRPLIDAPSLSADFLDETPLLEPAGSASNVRTTLLRLARIGRRRPDPSKALARPTIGELVAAGMNRDEPRLYALLQQSLDLSRERLRAMRDDETGRKLAQALKATGAKQADALSILMMMKTEIGLHVAAFENMAAFYRDLDVDACRRELSLPVRMEAVDTSARAPSEEMSNRRPGKVQGSRAAFGRRKIRPGEDKRFGS